MLSKGKTVASKIESDTPFDVAFMDFWGPGDIPYWDGSLKILTCLDFMTG